MGDRKIRGESMIIELDEATHNLLSQGIVAINNLAIAINNLAAGKNFTKEQSPFQMPVDNRENPSSDIVEDEIPPLDIKTTLHFGEDV